MTLHQLSPPATELVTRFSDGAETRAVQIAVRAARARAHLEGLFGVRPDVSVLVLSKADWPAHANVPMYGMPHYSLGRLILGVEPADFWRGVAKIVEDAHPDRRAELGAVYGMSDGNLELTKFFDLIVVHELGHAFAYTGHVSFPRLWLSEFFANCCLYSYLAAREPSELRTLMLVVELLLASKHEFQHRSLEAFERLYTRVGAENYCWYQFQLTATAAVMLRDWGDEAVRRLWRAFRLDDAALAHLLRTEVDEHLVELMQTFAIGAERG